MRNKTKHVLSALVILISLMILGIALLALHFRPRFVEHAISVSFLQQLREASSHTNTWANNPREVALRLVGADLFPIGRPPETDQAIATLENKSPEPCIVYVTEGFWDNETNALIATWDRISLRREGDIWVPYRREVSWQIKNRRGWKNDPLQ